MMSSTYPGTLPSPHSHLPQAGDTDCLTHPREMFMVRLMRKPFSLVGVRNHPSPSASARWGQSILATHAGIASPKAFSPHPHLLSIMEPEPRPFYSENSHTHPHDISTHLCVWGMWLCVCVARVGTCGDFWGHGVDSSLGTQFKNKQKKNQPSSWPQNGCWPLVQVGLLPLSPPPEQ